MTLRLILIPIIHLHNDRPSLDFERVFWIISFENLICKEQFVCIAYDWMFPGTCQETDPPPLWLLTGTFGFWLGEVAHYEDDWQIKTSNQLDWKKEEFLRCYSSSIWSVLVPEIKFAHICCEGIKFRRNIGNNYVQSAILCVPYVILVCLGYLGDFLKNVDTCYGPSPIFVLHRSVTGWQPSKFAYCWLVLYWLTVCGR